MKSIAYFRFPMRRTQLEASCATREIQNHSTLMGRKMAWVQFQREDRFQGSDQPFVSISTSHFAFNALFMRIADLSPSMRVSVFVDEEQRRVGFEFHEDARENSFALIQPSSDKPGAKRTGMNCTATAFVAKYAWVESVTRLPVKDRRFPLRKEGIYWVIQLMPSFENRRARESSEIPSDAGGIYRYVRENGEIVYIGRGNIKKRLQSPERAAWDFDVIEYSLVANPDRQVEWEAYWIDRHKKQNGGKLPLYNKQSGDSSTSS